jgi:hypothetical protein
VRELKAVLDVARALGHFRAPWWIAGGWAIDLHLGRVTREHHDVDVLILRHDQELLRKALCDFELKKIVPHPEGISGQGVITEWKGGERLELPVHQANAYRIGESELAFQIMLAETDGIDWIYRRDARVRRPLSAIGSTPLWGIPHLSPEIMILFKAKTMRSYDESDFENALPMLRANGRLWLRNALTIAHPGHKWIARL